MAVLVRLTLAALVLSSGSFFLWAGRVGTAAEPLAPPHRVAVEAEFIPAAELRWVYDAVKRAYTVELSSNRPWTLQRSFTNETSAAAAFIVPSYVLDGLFPVTDERVEADARFDPELGVFYVVVLP